MREVKHWYSEGYYRVSVKSVNGGSITGDSRGSHEEAVRDLYNYLLARVSLLENLIDILRQGYDDFLETCIITLEGYNYNCEGASEETIMEYLKQVRLDHKVSSRDIGSGSVEYVEVTDEQ